MAPEQSEAHIEQHSILAEKHTKIAGTIVCFQCDGGSCSLICRSCRRQHSLKHQLLAVPFIRFRYAIDRFQAPLSQSLRLRVSEYLQSALSSNQEEVSGTRKVPRSFKQKRQIERHCRSSLSVKAQKRIRNSCAEGSASRRFERGVKCVLVEHVHKLITERDGSIRKLMFID